MGKGWDKVLPSVDIWRECLRILKPGGFAFVMCAPRQDVLSRQIISLGDAGFNTGFTSIYWTYASGFPKAHNIKKNLEKEINKLCQLILNVNIVENNLVEVQATYPEQNINIVVESVEVSQKHLSLNVNIVEKNKEDQNVLIFTKTIIVIKNAIIKECELILSKITGEEVLKIELGNLKFLKNLDINALCVELIESWKDTILNQLRNFQNSDMILKMECVSVTNVIITKSIMECLITNTVDILEKKLKEELKNYKGSSAGFQPKPAVEVIIVVMKPKTEKTYAGQALDNGKGVIWLGDCRIPYESKDDKDGAKPGSFNFNDKTTSKMYSKTTLNKLKDSWKQPDGRFPANLLISDDVLDDGKTKKSSKPYYRTDCKGRGILGEYDGRKTKPTQQEGFGMMCNYGDKGTYSKFFSLDKWAEKNLPFLITPKASKSEKNKGLDKFKAKQRDTTRKEGNTGGDNPRNRGLIKMKNNHPTVKPVKLMSYLITMGSRPGDIILDPFAGSGTTGVAAEILNRKYILIEQDKEYFKFIEPRIAAEIKSYGGFFE